MAVTSTRQFGKISLKFTLGLPLSHLYQRLREKERSHHAGRGTYPQEMVSKNTWHTGVSGMLLGVSMFRVNDK